MNRFNTLISLYVIISFAAASFAGKDEPIPPQANHENIIIVEDDFDLYEGEAPRPPLPLIWPMVRLELPPATPIMRDLPRLPFNDAPLATRFPRVEFPRLDDNDKVMLACVLLTVAMKVRAW